MYPKLVQTVLDSKDPRRLAEFWRQFLGLTYRPGDEPPPAGEPDERGQDWLVLTDGEGRRMLAFQGDADLVPSTWPEARVPQQLHLDLRVRDTADLDVQCDRAAALGATLVFDRSDDADEPLRVYADPDGHPFCLFTRT